MSKKLMLLCATQKGVFAFESDVEDRQNWTLRGPMLPGWECYSVHGNRAGTRLFAGTHHGAGGATIQYSDDFGRNWAPVAKGPNFEPAYQFSYETFEWIKSDDPRPWQLKRIWQICDGAPTEPDTLYAGTEEAAVFRSTDGGMTWEELSGLTAHPTRPHWGPGAGGMGLHTILINPNNPEQIWVAMSSVGVFRSDDGGRSWRPRNINVDRVATADLDPDREIGRCAHKVCLDPDDPSVLYMQDHGGVFMSTDGADTWARNEEGLGQEGDERFGFPIAVSRTGDLFLMPLKSSEERTMRGGRMVVYRSTDRGRSWHPTPGDFDARSTYVNVLRDGMAVDDLDPYGFYFGTSSGEVFYTLDRGESWGRMPATLPRVTTVRAWLVDA